MPKAKKKKRKGAAARSAIDDITRQEIAEEILALEAIYASDFTLHQDGLGFALRVVPYTSEQDNYTAVELNVRYGRLGYHPTTCSLLWAAAAAALFALAQDDLHLKGQAPVISALCNTALQLFEVVPLQLFLNQSKASSCASVLLLHH